MSTDVAMSSAVPSYTATILGMPCAIVLSAVPYRQEFFVQPDLATIVMSRDLTVHLKQLGANTSRPMDLYEYRNIIQGRSGTGRDAHKQRAMVADFSFCPSGRQIAHIERIVSGMFLRRTNFTDLQRMVVASIAESANQIALGADRKKDRCLAGSLRVVHVGHGPGTADGGCIEQLRHAVV